MSLAPGSSDRYTHGHHPSVVGQHALRTAERDAAYLIPHLRGGMRLLDAGCGPGTITAGLAKAVAPGEAIGIDVSPEIIEQALALPDLEHGRRPRFEVADLYALPWHDASFNAAHAHQVLQHLTRPVEALRELRRILTPGGVLGVRDADYATMSAWPRSAAIDRWLVLYHQVARHNSAEPDAGRRLPSWLRRAGFTKIEVSATTMLFDERAAIDNWALSWAERVTASSLATQAIDYGLAGRDELEAIAEGWRAWAKEPEAFFMYVNVECVAWAPH